MAEFKIDADSIKPNSHKYHESQAQKEERDKLEPVVKKDGIVSTKKPLSRKFADTFLKEDTDDIKSYILFEVIIPGIKNTVLDILEMAFFGTVSGKKRGGKKDDDREDYRSYYGRSNSFKREDRRDRDKSRSRRDDKVDYRNIVLLNRDETEEVIDHLHKRIKKYGEVSIAELLDLIGEERIPPNDNNWGWRDERDIGIRRVSRGYLIDVAEAEYLG